MTVATLDANLPGLGFDTGASLFAELAERMNLPHSRSDRHLSLRMTSGEISLQHRDGGLTISLRADSDLRIYTLQQVVHSRLDKLAPVPDLIWDRVDEGAIPPTLARSLATLPENTAGHAVIMLSDQADRQSLICPPKVHQRWLSRSGAETLLGTLEGVEIPPTDRFIWFSSEKSEADAARAYIRADKGSERSDSNISAYWSKGAA